MRLQAAMQRSGDEFKGKISAALRLLNSALSFETFWLERKYPVGSVLSLSGSRPEWEGEVNRDMLLWKLASTAAGVMNVERTGTGIPLWVLCPTSLPQVSPSCRKGWAASRKLSRAIRRPVFCITLLSAAFPRVAKLEDRCGR